MYRLDVKVNVERCESDICDHKSDPPAYPLWLSATYPWPTIKWWHILFGPPYNLYLQHLGIKCKLRKCVPIYNLSIQLNIMKIGGKLYKLWSKKCILLMWSLYEKSRSRTPIKYQVHNINAGMLLWCKDILDDQAVFEIPHWQNWAMTKNFFFQTAIWPWPLTRRCMM